MAKKLITIINKNKYTVLMIIITLIFVGQMYLSLSSETDYLTGYIDRNAQNIDKLINVSILNKSNVTKTLFSLNVDFETSKLLSQVSKVDVQKTDELRFQLLEKFLPVYDDLQSMGIRQFQFHLPDGSSFLRLHKPASYGDNILSFRRTVDATIESNTPTKGFEEGRESNGYRYIYPIFHNTDYVGSVEMSYTLKSIVSPALKTYDLQALLVMDKTAVLKTPENTISKNYMEDTVFNEGYLDKSLPPDNIVQALGISQEDFDELNDNIACSVLKEHCAEEAFTYILRDNKLIWAYSYDVYNYEEKKVGSLVFYKNDPVLYQMVDHLNTSRVYTLSTTVLLFILLLISYFFFIKTNKQAIYDSLTELYNRYYYNNFVEKDNIEGALLIMDIDNFKQVNDQHGHDEGDRVLIAMAKIIKLNIRSTDVAMRWGGEEFMIILSDMTIEASLNKSKYLLKTIEDYDFDGIQLTASIGISSLGPNKEKAVKEADQALYYVKNNGKNNAMVYSEDMNES